LADSLAGVEVDKNLNQLKVQYETEQKEQALRIQRLELDQKTQQRNLLLGSSLALALLAVGIFAGLRRRLVTNRRMAQQESELQAQRIRRLEQEKQLSALHAMIEGQEKERTRIANDELSELVIAAPDRASLVARTHALDRVLLWNHWLIPNWHIPMHRIVYWNKFDHPRVPPKYGLGFYTWWVDADKAAKLNTR
jgi:hypothetical protein